MAKSRLAPFLAGLARVGWGTTTPETLERGHPAIPLALLADQIGDYRIGILGGDTLRNEILTNTVAPVAATLETVADEALGIGTIIEEAKLEETIYRLLNLGLLEFLDQALPERCAAPWPPGQQ